MITAGVVITATIRISPRHRGRAVRSPSGPVALALAVSVACGGGSANQNGARAAQEEDGASHVARIGPCTLVAKDEIRKKGEASQEPGHLARLNGDGAVWSITTDSATRGESKHCLIKWEVTANGEMRQRGDFYVTVATGEWFRTNLEDMKRKKQPVAIPGVGDEAYFTDTAVTAGHAQRMLRARPLGLP